MAIMDAHFQAAELPPVYHSSPKWYMRSGPFQCGRSTHWCLKDCCSARHSSWAVYPSVRMMVCWAMSPSSVGDMLASHLGSSSSKAYLLPTRDKLSDLVFQRSACRRAATALCAVVVLRMRGKEKKGMLHVCGVAAGVLDILRAWKRFHQLQQ